VKAGLLDIRVFIVTMVDTAKTQTPELFPYLTGSLSLRTQYYRHVLRNSGCSENISNDFEGEIHIGNQDTITIESVDFIGHRYGVHDFTLNLELHQLLSL